MAKLNGGRSGGKARKGGAKGGGGKKAGGGGSGKKPGGHSLDANRANKDVKEGTRSRATVNRLNMYRDRAKRDKKGRVLWQEYQSKELPSTRIQPDPRWFGNTRVIDQGALQRFQASFGEQQKDPFAVVLRERKLPLSLLKEEGAPGKKRARVDVLRNQSFGATFGPGAQRKKPKLATGDYAALVDRAAAGEEAYVERVALRPDRAAEHEDDGTRDKVNNEMFSKGQSRRIWGELYKVIDSSDVVIQVLDARDPMGTRSLHVESHLKKNCKQKHMMLLLNKCDLVRTARCPPDAPPPPPPALPRPRPRPRPHPRSRPPARPPHCGRNGSSRRDPVAHDDSNFLVNSPRGAGNCAALRNIK